MNDLEPITRVEHYLKSIIDNQKEIIELLQAISQTGSEENDEK